MSVNPRSHLDIIQRKALCRKTDTLIITSRNGDIKIVQPVVNLLQEWPKGTSSAKFR